MDTSELLKVLDAPAVAAVMYLWLRSQEKQIQAKDKTIADLGNRFASILEKKLGS